VGQTLVLPSRRNRRAKEREVEDGSETSIHDEHCGGGGGGGEGGDKEVRKIESKREATEKRRKAKSSWQR
jgi:hypothetical protein